MDETENTTTITVSRRTRERLAQLGKKDNTFDEIIRGLLDKIEGASN